MDANTTVVNALGEVTLGHDAQMGLLAVIALITVSVILVVTTPPNY